ncbi:hypothetical protein [Curtobacterium sp. BRB10]|uniref:ORC-CDC6 family AAA ATPase n=1 Tax=Curtobacterium sp. BRB10 TaxID=2962579 RepID=UPI0028817DFA|nr:hypothetical protein [Curtobacterium sp. BRB10]MDT0234958.1 hypothetical protein [Curtobacterium sp. BRB10]
MSVTGSKLELLDRALGHVRAEYEDDETIHRAYTKPLYFDELTGITPSFLVGGRGTGKTTTLRLMAHPGQARLTRSNDPEQWDVIGGYWKLEPSVVAAFKGRGLDAETWQRAFDHYLNLKLSTIYVEYLSAIESQDRTLSIDKRLIRRYSLSAHVREADTVGGLLDNIDYEIAALEGALNSSVASLKERNYSVAGKPLEYLFDAIRGDAIARTSPFMFCLDEYENLSSDQQASLNTLIKQVGAAPFTFKIGVRSSVAMERSTAIPGQPLQYPADYGVVDIVDHLKDDSFETFAETVVRHRFSSLNQELPALTALLPHLTLEEEARTLGAGRLKAEMLKHLEQNRAAEGLVTCAEAMTAVEAALVVRWAESHDESITTLVNFAFNDPAAWKDRVTNYGYAVLFAIRQGKVGDRKFYAGWKTFCQLADGNIRYLIRLVYEALRANVPGAAPLIRPIGIKEQTRAAAKVGETTIQDLQGWSRNGAALTRLSLGLGSIFGTLAKERTLATPEVAQFRVQFNASHAPATEVESLLNDAIGQGLVLAFEADKNGTATPSIKERDYQLHPLFAAYFQYSPRRKRRMTIGADDLLSMTSREYAASTIQRILATRGTQLQGIPDQLSLFEVQE